MMKNCSGCIVNVLSVVVFVGNFGQVNYVVSKVGFIGLICVFVKEYGGCGIIVNVIVLGFIELDMIVKLFEDIKKQYQVNILLVCFGQFEEVVVLVVFFVLEGVGYIIGQIIGVDGGMNLN